MKASVNIKVDSEIRDKAKELFGQMGLDMTTAVNMFLLAAIKEKGIPFAVTTLSTHANDRMFESALSEKLRKAEREEEAGLMRDFSSFAEEMKQKYEL